MLMTAALLVVLSPSVIAEDDECQVKVSGTLSIEAEAVFDDGENETVLKITNRVVSAMMEPGAYTLSVRSQGGTVYNEREVILEDSASFRFFTTKITVGNSGWKYGTDYTAELVLNNGKVSYDPISVDDTGISFVANLNDIADVTLVPSMDSVAKGFCPIHKSFTLNSVKTVYKCMMPAASDFRLTVPTGSEVSLGMKAFDAVVPFEIAPLSVEDDGEKTTYLYRLIVGHDYGYRVSSKGYADQCCVLNMKSGLKDEVTKEKLESLSADVVGKDEEASRLFLNINAEGFLRMDVGDSFEVNPQRVSYGEEAEYEFFLSPCFHYSAILPDGSASDVVSFDGNTMKAESEGTAFVLVTYEAVNARFLNMTGLDEKVLYAGMGKGTGLFVVTVGPDAGPDMNVDIKHGSTADRTYGSHFDSDLDYVYYAEGLAHGLIYLNKAYSGRSWQYAPVYSDGALVSFEKTETVDSATRCRAKVVDGPNVICGDTGSGISFQVVRAVPIKVTFINLDRDAFLPGDKISVKVSCAQAPAASHFYKADATLSLTIFGETYIDDGSWEFNDIVIPANTKDNIIHVTMKFVCSGYSPEFGSHRTGSNGLVYQDRSADFGTFTLKRYYISEFNTIRLDTMVGEDWDSSYEADAGAQGKTVDIGTLEVVAGKKMYLTLNRTSTQSMYGAKTITGTDGWMTCDTLASTTDKTLIVATPGEDNIGDHEFVIVLKLLNTRGTMKTTVTGKISVLETRTVVHISCVEGKSIALPGTPEGTPVPEGKEFKSWNTQPDGSGTEYKAGTLITPTEDVSLYAQYGSLDEGSTFLLEDLYYTVTSLDGNSGAVSVTGCTDSFQGDLVIPETVEYGGNVYEVESIGKKAFYRNENITTADLTAVKSVGYKAFPYCRNLESVKISGDVGAYAFFSCYKLSVLEIIGDSNLEKSAFSGCKKLTDITFPENITIGENAFFILTFKSDEGVKMSYDELAGHRFTGKNSVLKMYISEMNEVFEIDGFKYKVTSKNTVALIKCSDSLIESLIVPESVRHLGFDYAVTQIGTKTFYKFTNLKSVDLGCVDSIGIKAFAYCSSLEAVDLSDVREICPYAFYCCGSLKTLKLEDGTSVGAYAFYKCKGLGSIEFGSIPSIESNSFYGWVFWDPVTGKRLTVNADNLSNSLFEKVASKMVRS